MVAEKTESFKKYFPDFKIYAVPAIKNNRRGRAIGGYLYGFKNSLKNNGFNIEINNEGIVKYAKLSISSTELTLIPLYLRGVDCNAEFNTVKHFFEENNVANPIIIGDLNIRIGNLQQYIDDIYRQLFKAGMDLRNSNDNEVNSKGRQFIKFCSDENL